MPDAQSIIGQVILGSAQASISFSNIPQDYRDLYATIQTGITSGGENVRMTLNGDTNGANYNVVLASGNGTNASPVAWTSDSTYGLSRRIDSASYATTALTLSKTIWIFDYSATDRHKSSVFRSGLATAGVDIGTARWASSAAVTSVMFDMWTDTFRTGSIFTLYGVLA